MFSLYPRPSGLLRSVFRFAAVCAVAAVIANPAVGLAHEGHGDESTPAPAPADAPARGEAASGNFELVAVANGTQLLIYLDRFDSNEPVVGATIEVETPDGPVKAEAKDDAYRIPAPWLARRDKADLIISVTAGELSDVFSLTLPAAAAAEPGTTGSWTQRLEQIGQPALLGAAAVGFVLGISLMAFGRRRCVAAAFLGTALIGAVDTKASEDRPSHNAPAVSSIMGERSQRLPDGAVFVPKFAQRIFEVRTALAAADTHRRVVELPGRIIPDPTTSGFVQAAVGGRLSAPDGGFPRLGTRVNRGSVLAFVTPPLQAIDISDMRQRQGELDQQIAIVERRLARFETLVPAGAISRTQLEETKLELDGLRIRRASLDQVRSEPEPLIAPVSGVIAEGTPIAGQIAQPNAVIFHIVDPDRLWVEALSFELLAGAGNASAVTAAGKRLSLVYRGAGFADRSQSIPVHFAIEGGVDGQRAGQLVTVLVNGREEIRGIALPRASVARSTNGQDFVYLHVAAERFEPRLVRTEPLDADRVLVLAGIEPGQRVVTQGSDLLEHVR